MGLTDEQGTLAGRHRYDPYGQTVQNSTLIANPIQFAGQYLDGATGLYKIGVRYYDPAVGRWTQKDPLNLFQDPRQGNRYAYAGADPVNRTDPTGKDITDDVGEGIGLGCAVSGVIAVFVPPTAPLGVAFCAGFGLGTALDELGLNPFE